MRYFLVYKKIVSYKVKFIDSGRFIANSLSNLVNNLAELIHKVKCNDWKCFFKYESVNDNLIKYECSSWKIKKAI